MGLKRKCALWKKWIEQDICFFRQIVKKWFKKNRIFLFDTADHDNLGDHAIALAEIEFIKRELPDYAIIEVPGGNILRHTVLYKIFTRDTDIITIAGGGFLGSLWPFEEKIVQNILSIYKHNKIIIFPQTFFVEENDENFIKNHPGYIQHKNLFICLRDKDSCKRLEQFVPTLKNRIFYMPDMVCGLSFSTNTNSVREKAGICFREDKECVIKNIDKEVLREYLSQKNIETVEISTIESRMILPKERTQIVKQKLLEFSTKKLIITDRLHAMLFSAITSTPCIALDNKSGKVKGVYQWLSDQKYIYFANDIEDVKQYICQLSLEATYKYDGEFVKKYWKKLASVIRNSENYE